MCLAMIGKTGRKCPLAPRKAPQPGNRFLLLDNGMPETCPLARPECGPSGGHYRVLAYDMGLREPITRIIKEGVVQVIVSMTERG